MRTYILKNLLKVSFTCFLLSVYLIACKSDKHNASKTSFSLENPIAKDSTILVILEKLKNKDALALESLRDDIKPEMKLEIADYWKPSLHYEVKMGFVHIFMDQSTDGIEYILEDALKSKDIDTRMIALTLLLGPGTDVDRFYGDDLGLDIIEFNKGLKEYNKIKAAKK